MKHIHKKTINKIQLSENLKSTFVEQSVAISEMDSLPNSAFKDKSALLSTDNDDLFSAFFHKIHGKMRPLPMANPVLIYFHAAQIHLRAFVPAKDKMYEKFKDMANLSEDVLVNFYDYFGLTSSFVMLLMTAIEAFVNQRIPEDYNHEVNDSNYTKIYNADQIQRWLTLDNKIKKVINVVEQKSFADRYPLKQVHINNLKKLRDDIVHTKKSNGYANYEELYRTTLNFKYEEAMEAVKDFINFYDYNLIEPCPCDKDY